MKVKLIKSPIGRNEQVKKTIKALGIKKLNTVVEIDEKNKAWFGMYKKIAYMFEVV